MWDSESQRLCKKKCSGLAFQIHVIGELIGFIGLLMLIACFVGEIGVGIKNGLNDVSIMVFIFPFALGVLSEAMVQFSWWVVKRKTFSYDCQSGLVQWIENGQTVIYKYESSKLIQLDTIGNKISAQQTDASETMT